MSRYRDDWEDDYRGRPEYGGGRRERGPDFGREYGREFGRGFGRPDSSYRRDERDDPRGGRGFGPRGDYAPPPSGRGDYYRDEDYYGGLRRNHEEEPRGRSEGQRGDGPRPRGAARSHLRCRDIMTRDVTVASRDTTLDAVARKMRDEDTGIIPVVEPNEGAVAGAVTEQHRATPDSAAAGGKLVGLITDRDIVVRALAEGRDPRELRAGEVMSTDIHTALPNDRVIEVIRLMGDKQVRRVPVVDREGNLRGIISMADVALETQADRELADALEEISSGHSFWNRIFG